LLAIVDENIKIRLQTNNFLKSLRSFHAHFALCLLAFVLLPFAAVDVESTHKIKTHTH